MPQIQKLDDKLIAKIAAGEVIERPASVVKELVENAIDANATEVLVELVEGGKDKIRVADNGCGMDPTDAHLALSRHTTSKISSTDDLFNLTTMGFRGEALASIVSVSEFSLATRTHQDTIGIKIIPTTPSSEKAVTLPWPGSPGTEIVVNNLFFNIPVRKKFLKSTTAEYSACLEYLQALSLTKPEITLKLIHNGKEKFFSPKTRNTANQAKGLGEYVLRQRLCCFWESDLVDKLLYAQAESDYGFCELLMSPPGLEKATTRNTLMFANQRWVKDKTLRFGVQRGYHSHILKGKHPVCCLHFSCDPALVDVNVHPSKSELRFQYPAEVQGLIAGAIGNRLRQGDWAQLEDKSTQGWPSLKADSMPLDQNTATDDPIQEWRSTKSTPFSKVANPRVFHSTPKTSPTIVPAPTRLSGSTPQPATSSIRTTAKQLHSPQIPPSPHKTICWEDLQYIGQFAKCYLMFEGEQGLLIVDQHAFHERILYEQLKQDHTLLLSSQPMLIPEVLGITPRKCAIIAEHNAQIQQCGFSLRSIADDQVEVAAVPTILQEKNIEETILALVDVIAQGLSNTEAGGYLSHEILSTLSCHSAIRSGDELNEQMLHNLITAAKKVDFFHNCPHGRRVLRWHSKRDISKWFDRI
ncbi:MAG: DNA mismatch repair endonuclease MutL [Zetaproteobacteria bacterium]|nr:DNA mismatch repair endonuclease MutL [Zetaproteobacteria bacterium]